MTMTDEQLKALDEIEASIKSIGQELGQLRRQMKALRAQFEAAPAAAPESDTPADNALAIAEHWATAYERSTTENERGQVAPRAEEVTSTTHDGGWFIVSVPAKYLKWMNARAGVLQTTLNNRLQDGGLEIVNLRFEAAPDEPEASESPQETPEAEGEEHQPEVVGSAPLDKAAMEAAFIEAGFPSGQFTVYQNGLEVQAWVTLAYTDQLPVKLPGYTFTRLRGVKGQNVYNVQRAEPQPQAGEARAKLEDIPGGAAKLTAAEVGEGEG